MARETSRNGALLDFYGPKEFRKKSFRLNPPESWLAGNFTYSRSRYKHALSTKLFSACELVSRGCLTIKHAAGQINTVLKRRWMILACARPPIIVSRVTEFRINWHGYCSRAQAYSATMTTGSPSRLVLLLGKAIAYKAS